MTERATHILDHLGQAKAWRERSTAQGSSLAALMAIKQFQAKRFEHTYADWIRNPKSRRACRFFLDELYGPHDFAQRDAQFARIVPTLTRLFPDELSSTVETLVKLHALSERLDHLMAQAWLATTEASVKPRRGASLLQAQNYLQAWQAVGEPALREEQVVLMRAVGEALAVYTRRPLLRATLKLMRAPAAAAGLSTLQGFLEEGFAAFAALPDADAFLADVAKRERALIERLFAATSATPQNAADPLGQLP